MQKKLCSVLTLTVAYLAMSSAVNVGTHEYDNLELDNLYDLAEDIEDEDLDDFSKLLDAADEKSNSANKDSPKSKVKTSGFKKKDIHNEGIKSAYRRGDLKKFFKTAGIRGQGSYDDANVYGLAKGATGTALSTDGNQSRTYIKGSKTRGFHRVHHKDEYKKDREFYEDDETKGTINKVGAKSFGIKIGAGAGFSKGRLHHDRQKGIYGKVANVDKRLLNAVHKGYSDSQNFDGSF